jgi:hypothetical protein
MENIKQFDIPNLYLELKASDILRMLGYVEKAAPLQVLNDVKAMMKSTPEYIQAKCGFRYPENKNCEVLNDSFSIGEIRFNSGSIISSQLVGSAGIAVVVSTAGPSITQYSNELIESGEFLKGYIADVIGSIAAEQAADFAEKEVIKIAQSHWHDITNRLSPGYCGWDVADQHKLFALLPDNFCGITLTDSALMVPIKSTSAVIGIGKNVVKGDYPCTECGRDQCFRRR